MRRSNALESDDEMCCEVEVFIRENVAITFYVLRPLSPVLGVGRCLRSRTFCWSGEPFYVRMPFLTKTNDVYVGARTFSLSVETQTRNLYTTAGHYFVFVFNTKSVQSTINVYKA